jgi:integrase
MAREYGDAELTRLQIPDINRRRMVIHIRGGKGRQDRDVMLSPRFRLRRLSRVHTESATRKPARGRL